MILDSVPSGELVNEVDGSTTLLVLSLVVLVLIASLSEGVHHGVRVAGFVLVVELIQARVLLRLIVELLELLLLY